MINNKLVEVKKTILDYYLSFQKDGVPIAVNFRELVTEINKGERYTHQMHSYPAKLLSNIPYFFLLTDCFCPIDGIVLDPFCGTGTVLLEAILSGRQAYGADSNPLAELITEVKTHYIPRNELEKTLCSVLAQAKSIRREIDIPKEVAVWYSPSSLQQLARLQLAISCIMDEKHKAFFELCFSSVARKVSFADPAISVPVHWNPDRFSDSRKCVVAAKLDALYSVDVFNRFEAICKQNIDRVDTLKDAIPQDVDASVISKDARWLGLDENSVDLILTSPPYAGAQKYIRASWLNLYWLGWANIEDIRNLKKINIGREDYRKGEIFECYTGISSADEVLKELYQDGKMVRAFIVANYLNEMKVAMDEMCRVLKKGAYLVIVIGNNMVSKRSFDTQKYLTEYLVGKGMALQFKLIDDIKSYGLMTKRNKTADTISREWILVFKK